MLRTPLPRRCRQAFTSRLWIGSSNASCSVCRDGPSKLDDEELDAGDSHAVLADHLRGVVRAALEAVIGEDRLTRQVELVNRILHELEAADSEGESIDLERRRIACSASGPGNGSEAKSPSGPIRPWHSAACWPAPGSTPASSRSSARNSPRPTASTSFARSSSGAASASSKTISAPSRPAFSPAPRADDELPRRDRSEGG